MIRANEDHPPLAPRHRRRGSVLEEAILRAAWVQLVGGGYERFTFEAVAARACASKAVLYRRWPERLRLADAAALHHVRHWSWTLPSTGSLRDDLVAFLTRVAEQRRAIVVIASLEVSRDVDQRDAQTPLDYVESRSRELLDTVYVQAVARRELQADCLELPWRFLPVRLVWAESLLPGPIGFAGIVDEVVLPLLTHHGLMQTAQRDGEQNLPMSSP